MPTTFNLNIDSRSDSHDGNGITQNTSVRSEDPNDLIAVLQKLAGLATPAATHAVGPTGAVVMHQAPAAETPCGAMMESEELSMYHRGFNDGFDGVDGTSSPLYRDKEYKRGFHAGLRAAMDIEDGDGDSEPRKVGRPKDSMSGSGDSRGEGDPRPLSGEFDFSESAVNEALANAPKPKTMKNLLDIVNTDHTASTPNKITKSGHGDNPLPKDESDLMESRLMAEWLSEKINHYATELSHGVANRAIAEGRESFVDETREYAVRADEGYIKVYPIVEDRVMTQAPVYVVQESVGRDLKKLMRNQGPTNAAFDPKLGTDDRFTPKKLAALDVPPGMRTGEMEPVKFEKTPKPTHGRGRPMPEDRNLEEEKDLTDLSLFRLWNLHSNSLVMSRDPYVSTEISDDAKRVKSKIEVHVRDKYSPSVLHDMMQYSRHMMNYEMNPERNEEELERATSIARRYNFKDTETENEPADMMQKDQEADADLSTDAKLTHSEPKNKFGKNVSEAKKKPKNPYAIGMAAAMKATGDTPPLEKSTITKAHEIARGIKKGSKKK